MEGNEPTLDATTPSAVKLWPMPAPVGKPPESRFGERLREARQQIGLSVEALSRLCKAYGELDGMKVSPPTLGRYESGDTYPGLPELRLIADALDVPAQWLVDGSVPNAGKDAAVQALAKGLETFIRTVQEDIKLGELRLSEGVAKHRQQQRMQRLAQARKPSDNQR